VRNQEALFQPTSYPSHQKRWYFYIFIRNSSASPQLWPPFDPIPAGFMHRPAPQRDFSPLPHVKQSMYSANIIVLASSVVAQKS
jgi:hypothetical protein